MPSLTINPPRPPPPPPERNTNSTPPAPPDNTSFTFSAPPPGSATFYPTVANTTTTTTTSALSNDAGSPTAPEYSPITPKVQPILPAISSSQQYDGPLQQPPPPSPPPSGMNPHYPPPPLPQPQPQQQEHRHDAPSVQHQQQQQQPQLQPQTNNITPSTNPAEAAAAPAIPPTSFIPQPAPLPFSSEDSTDAIALRAAISALQFQKKKAQEDLRTLEHTKQHALKNPSQFKEALVAGKLKEERREFGGVQGILDENDSGEEGASDDEDGVGQTPAPDGEDDAMGGATEEVARKGSTNGEAPVAAGGRNTSDSAPPAPAPAQHDQEYNRSQSPTTKNPAAQQEHFPPIPGAQNVVRTPYINWEKYHILSEPLDRLHEQQRRWPGVGGISPSDQRRRRSEREYSVAAPYSPFYDRLDEDTLLRRRDDEE
ncbi:hypothetical protein KC332_g3183 [Hortaea werneckii]|nr:hypothetical protein KC332_g3183 [Hortaea werneckii]